MDESIIPKSTMTCEEMLRDWHKKLEEFSHEPLTIGGWYPSKIYYGMNLNPEYEEEEQMFYVPDKMIPPVILRKGTSLGVSMDDMFANGGAFINAYMNLFGEMYSELLFEQKMLVNLCRNNIQHSSFSHLHILSDEFTRVFEIVRKPADFDKPYFEMVVDFIWPYVAKYNTADYTVTDFIIQPNPLEIYICIKNDKEKEAGTRIAIMERVFVKNE